MRIQTGSHLDQSKPILQGTKFTCSCYKSKLRPWDRIRGSSK